MRPATYIAAGMATGAVVGSAICYAFSTWYWDDISTCDELLALSQGQFLCRYVDTRDTSDISYAGKLYIHGKFRPLPDGHYSTVDHHGPVREFQVANGTVMEYAASASISNTERLDFYTNNYFGYMGQYVTHCVSANTEHSSCMPAVAGIYRDQLHHEIPVDEASTLYNGEQGEDRYGSGACTYDHNLGVVCEGTD